jgi:hypothetical protein
MTVRRPKGSRWLALVATTIVLVAGGSIAACGNDGGDDTGTPNPDSGTFETSTPTGPTSEGGAGAFDAPSPFCLDASPDADIDCTGKCGPVRDLCSGKVKECGGCLNAVAPGGGDGGVQVCDLDTNRCTTPKNTCADLGAECGTVKNSCGAFLDCPDGLPKGCAAGKECDPDTHKCRDCQQVTCSDLGIECGMAWLGCGEDTPSNYTDCGSCPTVDGGAQVCNTIFHKCEPACVPKGQQEICDDAKAKKGVECGTISNGCGGTVLCEGLAGFLGCPAGQACGVRGIGNRCDPPAPPDECVVQGRNCGTITSACTGLTVNCGDCTTGQVCNANGVCGAACTPKTCADYASFECGVFDDGCGSTVTCGCSGGGVCDNVTNKCCAATSCSAAFPGECGKSLADGCGQNILDCSCSGGEVCTADGGAASAPASSATGLCCSPHDATFYTSQGQCGTNLPNGCGQNNLNASCPGAEVCVNNATGSAGPAPPNGTVGSCCTRTDSCTLQGVNACAPVQNSCRPAGTTVSCTGNCNGTGKICANDTCCRGAPACAGNTTGSDGAECNTTHTPLDPGCGSDVSCACSGSRTCWCAANATNPAPHVCVPGETQDVGQCKSALTCSSTTYKGHCGTALDNGIGGTVDCGCPNGSSCSTSAAGAIGACQCNNPTKAPYTCVNVPGGPGTPGGDGCGTFDNGCGGTVNCGCPGQQVCNTVATPNVCCKPIGCPANPAVGTACGAVDNLCGGTNNCGCPGGVGNENFLCTNGFCACQPDTCRGRTGPQPDRCGGTLQCGG